MNHTPKVSVLMLTYNQEAYVDEAIRSVMLQQTDFPFELVVGDDCSTDETAARCRVWKDNYPRQIRLLEREQNMGLIANFMDTYARCNGEYIAICEGDDFWTDSTKLQRQVDFLEAHSDYVLCFHRVINYYADKGTKSLSNGGQKPDLDILDYARSNPISNVSAVFRRYPVEELPEWFSTVKTYDYPLHLLNARRGKLHYMPRPMAVYRKHSKGIWSVSGSRKQTEIALSVRALLIGYFKEKGRPDVAGALQETYDRIAANAARRETHPKQAFTMKTALSKLRAAVSYFIPLPRIKG